MILHKTAWSHVLLHARQDALSSAVKHIGCINLRWNTQLDLQLTAAWCDYTWILLECDKSTQLCCMRIFSKVNPDVKDEDKDRKGSFDIRQWKPLTPASHAAAAYWAATSSMMSKDACSNNSPHRPVWASCTRCIMLKLQKNLRHWYYPRSWNMVYQQVYLKSSVTSIRHL